MISTIFVFVAAAVALVAFMWGFLIFFKPRGFRRFYVDPNAGYALKERPLEYYKYRSWYSLNPITLPPEQAWIADGRKCLYCLETSDRGFNDLICSACQAKVDEQNRNADANL